MSVTSSAARRRTRNHSTFGLSCGMVHSTALLPTPDGPVITTANRSSSPNRVCSIMSGRLTTRPDATWKG